MAPGIDVSFALDDASAAGIARCADAVRAADLTGAWITPAAARTADPEPFDDLLGEAVDGVSSMFVLVPPTGPADGISRAQRIAATAALRVIRLCPGGHGYPLVDWVLSPLPELCARTGLALALDWGEAAVPWRDVAALARAFPTVPMLVLGASLAGDRTAPAVLDVTANVLIEVTDAPGAAAAMALASTVGAHRFVWGSAGLAAGAAARAAISRSAALPADDRLAIVESNAAALADGTYAERFL